MGGEGKGEATVQVEVVVAAEGEVEVEVEVEVVVEVEVEVEVVVEVEFAVVVVVEVKVEVRIDLFYGAPPMAKKKASAKTILDAASTAKVFEGRPSKKEALSEVESFFSHLKEADVEAAGASIAHAHKDWWPHQVRSLWQDLVGPWLEEQGEDWDLDDDKSWRDLTWLEKIGIELETDWNGDDDSFFLNVTYDGEVTDVSAEFSIQEIPTGWVVRRDIIHVN